MLMFSTVDNCVYRSFYPQPVDNFVEIHRWIVDNRFHNSVDNVDK
jgi:hypothetical protein